MMLYRPQTNAICFLRKDHAKHPTGLMAFA